MSQTPSLKKPCVLLLIGAAMMVGAYLWFIHETAVRAAMARAEAKIVSNRETTVCRDDGKRHTGTCYHEEKRYYPTFEFTIGGRTLHVEHPVFSAEERPIGSKVTVRYDRAKPEEAEIDAPEVPPGWPFVLGIAALVPLYLSVRGLRAFVSSRRAQSA